MAAYMKTDQPFFGVKATPRHTVERDLRRLPITTADDYQAVVDALWREPEREMQYLALDVAIHHKRFHTPDHLGFFEWLARDGAWWDLVDPIATKLVGAVWARHREVVSPTMDRWAHDDSLWVRRCAIIGQLKHKRDTDTDRLFRYCLANADHPDFFIRKAIGWALRQHADVDPAPVQAFLVEHWTRLSRLSQQEASRKLQARGWAPPGE